MSGRAKRSAAYISTRMPASGRHSVRGAHQQRAVDGFLAQVYYEFLQRHGLVVDANEQVA